MKTVLRLRFKGSGFPLQIRTRQRHPLAKLVLHELLKSETTPRADRSLPRSLCQTWSDGQRLLGRQDRWATSPRTIPQSGPAVLVVPPPPRLHRASNPPDPRRDLRLGQSRSGLPHHPNPPGDPGILLPPKQRLQLVQGMMFPKRHAEPPALLTVINSGLRPAQISCRNWHAVMCWEADYKVLKTGCGVERHALRTAARLEPLIGLISVVGVRLLQLQTISKHEPDAKARHRVPTQWLQALKKNKLAQRDLTGL